jgi:Fe-S cluster assembly protein SufD
MTAVVEQRLDFTAASQAAGREWNDAPWQAGLRARAAKLATELDWPDSRAERPWKYYDATRIGLTPDTPLADVGVTIGGDAGGHAQRFSEVKGGNAEVLSRHLGTVVAPETDRLTALHYALLRDGVLVNVPANVEVAEPIRLARTVTKAGVSTPHTLIVTGANSRVTVVQEYTSTGEGIVALPVAEVLAGPGSEVSYYCVHNWGARTKVFAHQRFQGGESDASFRNLHLVLGGEVVKGHLESTLEGRGTASELLGVAYGTGATQADFYTLQDHIGPDTRSDLLYKSALRDSAQAIYYGQTRVGLGAKNADANQENRNLLLSKTARADSDPVLEILTSNIIRASHGATAGPVDQEQLYYLQARGIRHRDAEAMLVRAFLEAVLGRVPDERVRDELAAKLEAKLEQA